MTSDLALKPRTCWGFCWSLPSSVSAPLPPEDLNLPRALRHARSLHLHFHTHPCWMLMVSRKTIHCIFLIQRDNMLDHIHERAIVCSGGLVRG